MLLKFDRLLLVARDVAFLQVKHAVGLGKRKVAVLSIPRLKVAAFQFPAKLVLLLFRRQHVTRVPVHAPIPRQISVPQSNVLLRGGFVTWQLIVLLQPRVLLIAQLLRLDILQLGYSILLLF